MAPGRAWRSCPGRAQSVPRRSPLRSCNYPEPTAYGPARSPIPAGAGRGADRDCKGEANDP